MIVAIGTSPDSTWTPGQVDDRDALGLAAGVGDRVDLGAEDAAAVGEEERPVVGVGDEQVLDRVLLARDVADDPLAAAMLAAVGGDRLALDVAAAGDRDDDVLVGDEVLVGHLAAGVVGDPRPPLAGVLLLQLGELVLDDLADPGRVGEDVLELGDELDDREVLVLDLLALEGGQAGEPHVEDGLGLELGQVEPASSGCCGRPRRPADSRMVLMTASRLSRAILRPSRMCARARALARSNSVRRRMISRRWSR